MIRALILSVFILLVGANSYAQSTATLNWQDNSNNEDGFSVERSVDKEPFEEIGKTGVNTATFVDKALVSDPTKDIEHCYRVAAFNTTGKSGFSNTACAIVKRPLPGDPTQLIIQLQQALQGILDFKP